MRTLDGCPFCVENEGELTKITVLETDHFRVFPTFGQIREGYLLVTPKEHFPVVGSLPDSWFLELQQVKEEVDVRIRQHYDKPIWFEHGGLGQTIFHAHLHALPFPDDKDLFDFYHKEFPYYESISCLKELKDIFHTRSNYLYYEVNGHAFAFYTPLAPQYARLVAADFLGVPERGNWRTMDRDLDKKLIESTVEKLSA